MGKRKTIQLQIDETCQSIAKKMATLSGMIANGHLSDSLTSEVLAVPAPPEPKKPHRPKPEKDPHAPTRNLTSYIHYTNENRKKIVDANPGMAPRDVARTLGEGWRGLGQKEKARYDQLAKDDLQRYNDEMKAYKESAQGEDNNDNNKDDTNNNDNDKDDTDDNDKDDNNDIGKDDNNDIDNNSESESDDDSKNDDGNDDEEDELASDEPQPKTKQLAKRSAPLPKLKAKKNDEDTDSSEESSSSSSSSSDSSSSSSDSSDSD